MFSVIGVVIFHHLFHPAQTTTKTSSSIDSSLQNLQTDMFGSSLILVVAPPPFPKMHKLVFPRTYCSPMPIVNAINWRSVLFTRSVKSGARYLSFYKVYSSTLHTKSPSIVPQVVIVTPMLIMPQVACFPFSVKIYLQKKKNANSLRLCQA